MPFSKIKKPVASTDDLIAQIERKDRRFRIAQALFMASTLIALIVVISAQQRTLSAIKDQLFQAKMTAQQASKQSDDQRDKIIRRLDCIVVFFGQDNRTDLTIDDIDRCSLNRDQSVQQFFSEPESTPAELPPNLTPGSSPSGAAANTPGNSNYNPQRTVPTPPGQNDILKLLKGKPLR